MYILWPFMNAEHLPMNSGIGSLKYSVGFANLYFVEQELAFVWRRENAMNPSYSCMFCWISKVFSSLRCSCICLGVGYSHLFALYRSQGLVRKVFRFLSLISGKMEHCFECNWSFLLILNQASNPALFLLALIMNAPSELAAIRIVLVWPGWLSGSTLTSTKESHANLQLNANMWWAEPKTRDWLEHHLRFMRRNIYCKALCFLHGPIGVITATTPQSLEGSPRNLDTDNI